MADVNHVILIGRLTRNAELKYTAGGQAVCKFSLAVNRRKKSGDQWIEEASFFDVVLWGRSGEAVNQYLLKGKQIAVSGSLVQERWEKDGQQHSSVLIVSDSIQLLADPRGSDDRNTTETRQEDKRKLRENAGKTANTSNGDYTFDNDIPF